MFGQVPQKDLSDVSCVERLSIVEAYVRLELHLPGQTIGSTLPTFREALFGPTSGRVRHEGLKRNEAKGRLKTGSAALARCGPQADRQGDI